VLLAQLLAVPQFVPDIVQTHTSTYPPVLPPAVLTEPNAMYSLLSDDFVIVGSCAFGLVDVTDTSA